MEYGDAYDNVFRSVFIELGALRPVQSIKEICNYNILTTQILKHYGQCSYLWYPVNPWLYKYVHMYVN